MASVELTEMTGRRLVALLERVERAHAMTQSRLDAVLIELRSCASRAGSRGCEAEELRAAVGRVSRELRGVRDVAREAGVRSRRELLLEELLLESVS